MKTERIAYSIGALKSEGVLIFDEAQASGAPLLLMAPNWLGVTDSAVAAGRDLAEKGYVIFLLDLFGTGNRPAGTEEPLEFLQPYFADPAMVAERANAALETMTRAAVERNIGDVTKRAAIGYCFGGSNVLDLARSGADLAAVVSMHGTLKTSLPARPGAVKASILVIHGADDPISPKADRDALEEELRQAGAQWAIFAMGDVYHSFTDPGANEPPVAAYNENATRYGYMLAHSLIADAIAARR